MYCNLVTENNLGLGVGQFFKKIFFLLNLTITERVRLGVGVKYVFNYIFVCSEHQKFSAIFQHREEA